MTSKKFPICGRRLGSTFLDSPGVLIHSPPWGWARQFEKPSGPSSHEAGGVGNSPRMPLLPDWTAFNKFPKESQPKLNSNQFNKHVSLLKATLHVAGIKSLHVKQ